MTATIRYPGLMYGNSDPAYPMDLDPAELPKFRQHGYRWASRQVVNTHPGSSTVSSRDVDLQPIRAAGMEAYVWGVFENPSLYFAAAKRLGEIGVQRGAGRVQVNNEQAGKGTRGTEALKPIVDGVRAGGFMGPIDFCPLGHPSDPLLFDFAYDTNRFIATGGMILPQCYGDAAGSYDAVRAAQYWRRFVPSNVLCLGIAFYGANIQGPAWKDQLVQADALLEQWNATSFWIYMPQMDCGDDDLAALDPLSKGEPYTPPAQPGDPAEGVRAKVEGILAAPAELTAADMNALVAGSIFNAFKRRMDRQGTAMSPKMRATLNRRIASTTNPQMLAADDQIKQALDDAGASQ